MRVLVCGSRNRKDSTLIRDVMDRIHAMHKISLVIEGGQKGVDKMAGHWAVDNNVAVTPVPAEWQKYKRPGKKNPAGPIRNKRMLREHQPSLVVAFPGGPGTASMVALAQENDVVVSIISEDGKGS